VAEPVRIAASVAELLDGATDRQVLVAEDGKSGNWLERVTLHGQRHVAKHLTYDGDWIMRVMGDRDFWAYRAAQAGLFDQLPPTIDHAVVGLALDREGPARSALAGEATSGELVFLMHDVGTELVPEGDEVVAVSHHRDFLAHMAQMHAAYWGWTDDLGLQTMAQRLLPFAPDQVAVELRRPEPRPVPLVVAARGWACLPELAPDLAEVVFALHRDPTPLTRALADTPATFLHGDWKMGNLGRHADGRTILLDWAYLGAGPPLWDLMWYLALNRARLPESKEQSIECYRAALEATGIATEVWWDRQLALATVAIMVCFAWEKAVGDADELAWWAARVAAAGWAM
jgi:hypothetical protein